MDGTYVFSHDIRTVRRVEEMPVSEHGVPEHSFSFVVDDVDIEFAERRLVAYVEEGVGGYAFGVVVGQAGEEERAPLFHTV